VSDADPTLLILRVQGERTQLLSPGVGMFSGALPLGTIVSPGQSVGVLATLEKRARLVVPDGVHGLVSSAQPARKRAPVGYGDVLYELTAVDSASAAASTQSGPKHESGADLAVRSPQSGRFYHRSGPGEPSMCEPGRELELGTPIGLIEVMKTFTQLVYRPERGLPARARIVRVQARDASDVEEGAVLFEVAPR